MGKTQPAPPRRLAVEDADVEAALAATGDPTAAVSFADLGGDLMVIVPSIGSFGVFAAALATQLTAWVSCACCANNECECEGRDLERSDPGAAAAVMARASGAWQPGVGGVPVLVVSFPGVRLARTSAHCVTHGRPHWDDGGKTCRRTP